MPVPATIADLSTTAGSNSPAGGETPKDGDNYIRALSSFIAVLRDKTDQFGTYTPTVHATTTNVVSATPSVSMYIQLGTGSGSMVIVFGQINVDPTASNSVTQLMLSLPVASDITSSSQVAGSGGWASSGGSVVNSVFIDGVSSVDHAQFTFYSGSSNASASLSYIYAYLVI